MALTAAARLRSYLELVRVFLTPTAVADSFAGLVLVQGEEQLPPGKVAAVAATSICLYWFGLAANDLLDRHVDRLKAPARPLPSSRVTPRSALWLSASLGAAGLGLACWLGVLPMAATIFAAALIYDAGGKHLFIAGNLLLGLCRGANFLLGAAAGSLAGPWSNPAALAGAAILGLYVALVTAVSRLEDAPLDGGKLKLLALPLFLVPLALLLAAARNASNWLNSILLVLLLLQAWRAALRGSGGQHGAAIFVRQALPGIFLVDAGIVLALSPPGTRRLPAALALYLLFLLAWAWKRRWLRLAARGS